VCSHKTYKSVKIYFKKYKMNMFRLACDVLQAFTIISKLLEVETTLKLTYEGHNESHELSHIVGNSATSNDLLSFGRWRQLLSYL